MPKRGGNNVPQDPGSESGAWKCKLCDGLIVTSPNTGMDLGHHGTCPCHPDYQPPNPGDDREM